MGIMVMRRRTSEEGAPEKEDNKLLYEIPTIQDSNNTSYT